MLRSPPVMRAGDDERAGFDAVGNDAVLRAFQFADAFDANGGRARAFDLRSHFVEQVGEVGDFGLAGAVLHERSRRRRESRP